MVGHVTPLLHAIGQMAIQNENTDAEEFNATINDEKWRQINLLISQSVGRLEALFETAIEAIQEQARRDSEERTARLATIWFGTKPIRLADTLEMHIEVALAKNKYNVSATAKDLGMHRRSLQRIIRRNKTRKRRQKHK